MTTLSLCGPRKLAATAIASCIVTTHGPVPVHGPGGPQPRNTESGDAVACSVTSVPTRYEYSQSCDSPGVFEHDAGGGLTCTTPEPFCTLSMTTLSLCGPRNLARTLSGLFMVTVHVGLADSGHAGLDHPRNTESGDGTAVRVTVVPTRYECWQYAVVPGELELGWSGGLTRTEPDPPSMPSTATYSVCGPRNLAIAPSL